MRSFRIALLLLAAAAAAPARAADPSADEIIQRSLESFYYAGHSMRARVNMKLINRQGNVRERDMTMLRLNLGNKVQKRFQPGCRSEFFVAKRTCNCILELFATGIQDRNT